MQIIIISGSNEHTNQHKGHKVGFHWVTESYPNSPLWPPSDKYTKMAVVIKEELAKSTEKMRYFES